MLCAAGTVTAQRQKPDRREQDRVAQAQREEGEAILALADAVMNGTSVPAEIRLTWHNDFLKAQQGTFVPFVVSIAAPPGTGPAALLYLRGELRKAASREGEPRGERPAPYPIEAIYPIDVPPGGGAPIRVARGFAVAPGEYDLVVVVRERPGGDSSRRGRKAGVLKTGLSVPDFWSGELTTSSPILADRLTTLREAPSEEELAERPYVIGINEIEPAADSRFRKDEELIVVFLVYNPSIAEGGKFDIEVEYHFFWKTGRPGTGVKTPEVPHPPERPDERYFNRTEPQRFNPSTMGAGFDPSKGQPVMAGQGVPLANFEDGEYRLAIKVTDLISGKSLVRDVLFSVGK
jgi:hypothetical protein